MSHELGSTPESHDIEPANQEQLGAAHDAIKEAVFRDGLAYYDTPAASHGERQLAGRMVPIMEDQPQFTLPMLSGTQIAERLHEKQQQDPGAQPSDAIQALSLPPNATIELSHFAETFTLNPADAQKPVYAPANSILAVHDENGTSIYGLVSNQNSGKPVLVGSKEVIPTGEEPDAIEGLGEVAGRAERQAVRGDLSTFLVDHTMQSPEDETDSTYSHAMEDMHGRGMLDAASGLSAAEAQAIVDIADLFGR